MLLPEELTDTAEKLATARARYAETKARHDALNEERLAARGRREDAEVALADAPAAIRRLEWELTCAMRQGEPTEALQAKVAAANASLPSLRALLEEAKLAEGRATEIVSSTIRATAQAQIEVENCEIHDLIYKISRHALEMLPLCAELRRVAPARGIALGDSGFLLDGSRPNIGPYRLTPDGSMRHVISLNTSRPA